jgi:hypothetical protein
VRPALLLLTLLLAACATAADIKPGVVRGLDGRYVKTSEGFGVALRGCSDVQIWRAALGAVEDVRPRSARIGDRLTVTDADEARGRIAAVDSYLQAFAGGSYVGVFIHRLNAEDRLVEVSAFWRSRIGAAVNPWERIVLEEIERRLPCVVPAEQALLRR